MTHPDDLRERIALLANIDEGNGVVIMGEGGSLWDSEFIDDPIGEIIAAVHASIAARALSDEGRDEMIKAAKEEIEQCASVRLDHNSDTYAVVSEESVEAVVEMAERRLLTALGITESEGAK